MAATVDNVPITPLPVTTSCGTILDVATLVSDKEENAAARAPPAVDEGRLPMGPLGGGWDNDDGM